MFVRFVRFTYDIIIMTKVYGRKTVHNVIPPGFVMGHRQEHPAGGFLHSGRGNVTRFVR